MTIQNNSFKNLKKFLEECAKLFDEMKRYKIADSVIEFAVKKYPNNNDYEEVSVKVSLINLLYSTRIQAWRKVAEHILNLNNLDEMIQKGNIEIIEKMRYFNINGKKRGCYSFATKYANWHKPEKFPIFDNLVKRLLQKINKKYSFYREFTQTSLENDYSLYKKVVDELIDKLELPSKEFKYKKIDQALWVYAKYKNKKEDTSLSEEIRKKIKCLEKQCGINIDY